MIADELSFFNEQQAADFLTIAPRTLAHWRFVKRGPKYIKISHRCVRYQKEDLVEFMHSLEVNPSSVQEIAEEPPCGVELTSL